MIRLVATIIAFLFMATTSTAFAQTVVATDKRVVRYVVVREGPSTSTPAIDSLDPGETFTLKSDRPNWYEIVLPDGRTGFVSKAWTVPVDGPAGEYRVHVIDVGTGLAIFVEGPDFTLLYDAGSNDDSRKGRNNRVLAYLAKIRPDLTTIDHVILEPRAQGSPPTHAGRLRSPERATFLGQWSVV